MSVDYEKMEYMRHNIGGVLVNVSDDSLLDFERYMHNRSAKLSRVKLRLFMMVRDNPYVYFITQSFTDETLTFKNLKATICKRFQRSGFNDYFYNYDYGEKKGRLHFHAFVASDHELTGLFDDLGNVELRRLSFDNLLTDSFKTTAEYFARHAIKITAEVSNIHYKRMVYAPSDVYRGKTDYLKYLLSIDPDDHDVQLRLFVHMKLAAERKSTSGIKLPESDSEKASKVLQRYNIKRETI